MVGGRPALRELRRALEMLTTGAEARVPKKLRAEAAALAREHERWASDPGVVGFGVAERVTRGSPQGRAALKVYVERKLPRARCASPAPARLAVGSFEEPVEIDVEAIGRLELHALAEKVRPLVPGYSLAHPDCEPGSLGCLAREPDDPTRLYLLGSAHVLARYGLAQAGDPVLQPARRDDADEADDAVAELVRWQEVRRTPSGHPNASEGAIARLLPGVAAEASIPLIGPVRGIGVQVRRKMRVRKTGRSTHYSEGRVRDVDFKVRLRYPLPGRPNAQAGFHVQVLCTPYAAPGDSGAAVVDDAGRVVGLHVGGSEAASFFSRIRPVLRGLAIELVTDPVDGPEGAA